MEIIYFLILLFAAVLCGTLAERKGRDGFAGFLAGLLLGPLAWLIVLLLKPQKSLDEIAQAEDQRIQEFIDRK